jgi:hypothetical protein
MWFAGHTHGPYDGVGDLVVALAGMLPLEVNSQRNSLMGQIIDFHQYRLRIQGEASATASSSTRPLISETYVTGMLLPGMALWRSLMVSYAALWLAPLGIEVQPIEARARPPEKERATGGG